MLLLSSASWQGRKVRIHSLAAWLCANGHCLSSTPRALWDCLALIDSEEEECERMTEEDLQKIDVESLASVGESAVPDADVDNIPSTRQYATHGGRGELYVGHRMSQ